jgi:hypothetical protein
MEKPSHAGLIQESMKGFLMVFLLLLKVNGSMGGEEEQDGEMPQESQKLTTGSNDGS